MRKTLSAAIAVAVIGASAMAMTTTNSQAGYYGGYHGGYHGYNYGYKHHCFYKKVKVWGHYGYFWKRIKVCR